MGQRRRKFEMVVLYFEPEAPSYWSAGLHTQYPHGAGQVGDRLVGYRDACRAILLWIPTAMVFFQWVVSFNRS